jgi:hypothetical protein
VSVDLNIPGDVEGLRALGDWLSPQLSTPIVDADLELIYLGADSSSTWVGQSGNAFRGAISEVSKRSRKVPTFLEDLGAALRAYSNQLKWGQEDFDEYAKLAAGRGVTVVNNVMMPPTTSLQYCPTASAPASEIAEYYGYLDRTAAYNEVSTKYGIFFVELDEWIADNLVPLMVRIEEMDPLVDLAASLLDNSSTIVGEAAGLLINVRDTQLARKLAQRQAEAAAMRLADEKFRKGNKSGNPALRAASESTDGRAITRSLRSIDEAIDAVELERGALKILGRAVPVITAAYDIANGESATSTAAGLLGGAGGSALVAGIAATLPLWAGALVVGGAGIVAGGAATWLWEDTVPIDVREAIDHTVVPGQTPMLLNNGPASPAPLASR